jgi:hypothetical protein
MRLGLELRDNSRWECVVLSGMVNGVSVRAGQVVVGQR